MTLFIDLWHTNLKILRKTVIALKNNKSIFALGIPYLIVLGIAAQLASGLSFFAGLIMLLIQSAILSDYLWIMGKIIRYGKFSMNDFKIGYKIYFRKVYISLLLIRFAYFGIEVFLDYFSTIEFYATMILNISVLIFLNPLIEVIYQKNLQEWDGFKYAYRFIVKNWIEWFIPNIVIISSIYFVRELITVIMSIVPINAYYFTSIISLVLFAIFGQFFIIMMYQYFFH